MTSAAGRPGRPDRDRQRGNPGLRRQQEGRRGRAGRPRRRPVRPPGAALRRGHRRRRPRPRGAAGAAGHGHLRQGRHAPAHRRVWSTRRASGSRSFKAPTEEELEHDFLWRIRKALPGKGIIGVFDRSHYEDVLIVRVRELAPTEEIERRYDAINDFESRAGRRRHHDRQVHAAHLGRRRRRSGCSPGSTTRPSTGSSTPATSTSAPSGRPTARPTRSPSSGPTPRCAPWYVVPSDRKWYRNLAIGNLLHETLTDMNPQWPAADFDVDEQKRRLADEAPIA